MLLSVDVAGSLRDPLVGVRIGLDTDRKGRRQHTTDLIETLRDDSIMHPAALAMTGHQTGLAQNSQMVRNSGLAEAEW